MAEEKKAAFSGYAEYWVERNRKLREQHGGEIGQISSIMDGVTVWVDGYVEPGQAQLRHLLGLHGGKFEYFYRRDLVTHIVATNLTPSKIQELRSYHRVVRPEWIIDSIKEGRQLPIADYSLYRSGAVDRSQLAISSLFAGSAMGLTDAAADAQHDARNSSIAEATTAYASDVDDAAIDEDKQEPDPTYDETVVRQRLNPKDPAPFIRQYGILRYLGLSNCMKLKAYTANLLQQKRSGVLLSPSLSHFAYPQSSPNASPPRTILHVDLDCFFVSVVVRDQPQLRGLPVVVSHGSKFGPTGEIAAASYEARAFGVRSGMWMAQARELCPDIVVVPYEFDKYEVVSRQMYRIFVNYTDRIEVLSCDEALLDVTGLDGEAVASAIRADILRVCGVNASAGIGSNILMAKLALSRAKPNGQFAVREDQVAQFLTNVPVRELPGVGGSLSTVLQEMGISTVGELQGLPKERLQEALGPRKGDALWHHARGLDDAPVQSEQPRKSVGIEINWGLRFAPGESIALFIDELCAELEKRVLEIRARARFLTLKIMRRKPDAVVTKYLGHGPCDVVSRGIALHALTSSASLLSSTVKRLFRDFAIPVDDVRGFGIHLSRLTFSAEHSSVAGAIVRSLSGASAITVNSSDASLAVGRIASTVLQHAAAGQVSYDALPGDTSARSQLGDISADAQRDTKRNCETGGVTLGATPAIRGRSDQLANAKRVRREEDATVLDVTALSSLPPDLRKEVLEQYGLSRESPELSTVSLCSTRGDSAFEREELRDVLTLLRHWMLNLNEIRPVHTELLLQIALNGFHADDLEWVQACVRAARRAAFETTNWRPHFNVILQIVQAQMLESYGAPLPVAPIEL